jgi:hypothetical protein
MDDMPPEVVAMIGRMTGVVIVAFIVAVGMWLYQFG